MGVLGSATRRAGRSPFSMFLQRLFPDGTASLLRYLAMVLVTMLACLSLFPLYWAVITSFKHPSDVATIPPSFILTRPSLQNYQDLIEGTGIANAPVGLWFMNSLFVSVTKTIGTLIFASMAGYSFARKQFPGRDALFWVIIATMLIPGWSTIIASYAWTLQLGMHDTFYALILPGLAGAFSVFLFRQFAVTLPDELFQAGRIDGASEFGLFWRIAIPLCRPVLATLGIFTLVGNWNNFLWPLLVLNKTRLYTLPVGVSVIMYQIQGTGPSYGKGLAAAMIMSVVPIIAFLLVQRQMIKGLTLGAIKG